VNGEPVTLKQAAAEAGVTAPTLRRWVERGLIPGVTARNSSRWSAAAVAHARMVARLRARGHSLEHIRRANREGRLAYGFVEDLFPSARDGHALADVAGATGLEPALIERIWTAIGLPPQTLEQLTDEDVQALRYIASVLDSGFPLVAFLQLSRVYGQALAQIADAEVRLFHIYVHEPLIRDGVPGLRMAEQMEHLARDLLPLSSPLMDYAHQRFLQHFIEQDVVGHMELEFEDELDPGRVRVAIAFADLAGYTRFTEEEGEAEALSFIERFIESAIASLPEGARLVKTIGDEAMIVGQDVTALVEWAVDFQRLFSERPEPRIAIHAGATVYRDGDYFGRAVNLASRVVARARGGEVLVTQPVVEAVRAPQLEFEEIGQVKLKGFSGPTRLCRVSARA
jgi:adenylate cyclase